MRCTVVAVAVTAVMAGCQGDTENGDAGTGTKDGGMKECMY
ncbi:MAG: hypothetical protein WC889_19980 [Myxococcota bacterium]|jgi:hypothetical protein